MKTSGMRHASVKRHQVKSGGLKADAIKSPEDGSECLLRKTLACLNQ